MRLLLVALLALQTSEDSLSLASRLPDSVPSVVGWERITGEAELANPDFSLRYEFYVKPGRAAAYEVVRYRFSGPGALAYGHHERLQWDVNGRRLHRFECRAAGPGRACAWSELARESPAFQQQTGVLLWLYSLHRRLLAERDAAAGAR